MIPTRNKICPCHTAHVERLEPVIKELERCEDPSVVSGSPDPACWEALHWLLSQAPEFECDHFLEETRSALKNPPKAFRVIHQEIYSQLYGVLLHQLVKRHIITDLPELWTEIRDSFTDADDSDARKGTLETLRQIAELNYPKIIDTHSDDFKPFWNTVNHITACLAAIFDLPVRDEGDRLAAATAYCNFLYLFADGLLKDANLPRLHTEVLRQLAEVARLALRLEVAGEPELAQLKWWADAVCLICTYAEQGGMAVGGGSSDGGKPDRQNRPTDLQNVFDKIADNLVSSSRAERRRRDKYKRVLESCLPLLRGYPRASRRKSLEFGSVSKCTLALKAQQAVLPVKAVPRDVCTKSHRGFCVETSDVSPIASQPDGGEFLAGVSVDGYGCRQVQVRDKMGQQHIVQDVRLELLCEHRYRNISLCLDCKIVRAWRLPGTIGTGLAILAPTAEGLPPGWTQYVEDLPFEGRYQA